MHLVEVLEGGRQLCQHRLGVPQVHTRDVVAFEGIPATGCGAAAHLPRCSCRVPDDWLLKNKRPMLHGREVLQAVLATWQASAKELPC